MRPQARVKRAPPAIISAALLRRWPMPSLARSEGKEDRGRVLVVGGSEELPGSLLLAAEAALRAGAGKLQAATVRSASAMLAVRLPEAKVMALPSRAGSIAGATASLLRSASDADAVLVGCGMDSTVAARRLVRGLVRNARGPVVLDAGALAGHHRAPATGPLLLTPNLGEMASLTGLDVDRIARTQLDVARDYAREHRVFVALKGVSTVVCNPAGAAWIYEGGAVGLGTSGSGDVLAGIVAGLLARGAEASQALAWGAFIHGESGRRLSRRIGAVGFLAREILPEIPVILQSLAPRAASRRRAGRRPKS